MTTRETELLAANAALELEVVKLRSVLANVIKAHGYEGGTPTEVMSTTFTPTALSAMIAEAGEVMRERCERESWLMAPVLRSIPEVTLEDLQK